VGCARVSQNVGSGIRIPSKVLKLGVNFGE
jgi:hypothetical protein